MLAGLVSREASVLIHVGSDPGCKDPLKVRVFSFPSKRAGECGCRSFSAQEEMLIVMVLAWILPQGHPTFP